VAYILHKEREKKKEKEYNIVIHRYLSEGPKSTRNPNARFTSSSRDKRKQWALEIENFASIMTLDRESWPLEEQ